MSETVLHTFTGVPDGSGPGAGVVIGQGGVLYGTTVTGGTGSCIPTDAPAGCGTVFSLAPPTTPGGAWTETVLYNFAGGSDGAIPGLGSLVIGSGGVLYGTTEGGGTSSAGTVFSLTPPASPGGAWAKAVLYSFTGAPGKVPRRAW